MNKIVSVVPSKYDDIFKVFADAYLYTISSDCLVIDDGLSEDVGAAYDGFKFVPAPSPFGFAKSVNKGIRLAEDADVIVWNDDCFIHTLAIDKMLRMVAYASPEIGLVTPMMTNVKNAYQYPENKPVDTLKVDGIEYTVRDTIITFGCVYLKREILNEVGLLDEAFLIGREDVDFGIRLEEAGYKVAICHSAFVEHGGDKFEARWSNTRHRAGNVGTRMEDIIYFDEKHGGRESLR